MFREVLVAAAAGFSWPYFFDVTIPGIPSRHVIRPIAEINLSARSHADDTIFATQVANRSQKGDRLKIHQTTDLNLSTACNARQTTNAECRSGKQL